MEKKNLIQKRKKSFFAILASALLLANLVPMNAWAAEYKTVYADDRVKLKRPDGSFFFSTDYDGSLILKEGDKIVYESTSISINLDSIRNANNEIIYYGDTIGEVRSDNTEISLNADTATMVGYAPYSGAWQVKMISGGIGLLPIKHGTVTFDLNGHGSTTGSLQEEVYFRSENEYIHPVSPEPTDPNYEFGGWYMDEYLTRDWLFDQWTVTAPSSYDSHVLSVSTLYAKWTPKNYTVTFVGEDGTQLESKNVAYGTVPTYTGTALTKAKDAVNTYTFTGWSDGMGVYASGELPPVAGNTTYTAVFSSSKNSYTVTFKNYDGRQLQQSVYEYGSVPVYGGTALTRETTESTIYTFAGWSNGQTTYSAELPAVAEDVTYTAVFTESENTNGRSGQLEISEGYTAIDDSLKEIGLNTEAKVKDAMYQALVDDDKKQGNETKVKVGEKIYDVEFVVSFDGGSSWQTVTPETFPEDGLDVVIPYPEGTNKDDNDFSVVHMFTHTMNGHNPGDTEVPAVTKTDEGLCFKVTGLSPVYVMWTLAKAENTTETQEETKEETKQETQQVTQPVTEEVSEPIVIASVPKTGENNMLMVWVAAAAVTGALSIVYANIYLRKKKK